MFIRNVAFFSICTTRRQDKINANANAMHYGQRDKDLFDTYFFNTNQPFTSMGRIWDDGQRNGRMS